MEDGQLYRSNYTPSTDLKERKEDGRAEERRRRRNGGSLPSYQDGKRVPDKLGFELLDLRPAKLQLQKRLDLGRKSMHKGLCDDTHGQGKPEIITPLSYRGIA